MSTDDNYVSDEDWQAWERERLARNSANDERALREAFRPKPVTAEDLRAQLDSLRAHNAALLARVDELEARLSSVRRLAYEAFSEALVDQQAERHLRAAA